MINNKKIKLWRLLPPPQIIRLNNRTITIDIIQLHVGEIELFYHLLEIMEDDEIMEEEEEEKEDKKEKEFKKEKEDIEEEEIEEEEEKNEEKEELHLPINDDCL